MVVYDVGRIGGAVASRRMPFIHLVIACLDDGRDEIHISPLGAQIRFVIVVGAVLIARGGGRQPGTAHRYRRLAIIYNDVVDRAGRIGRKGEVPGDPLLIKRVPGFDPVMVGRRGAEPAER